MTYEYDRPLVPGEVVPAEPGLPKQFVVDVPRPVDEDDPELAWQADAACAQTDPEAFFPEKGGSSKQAKRVCQSCEVAGDCLLYALVHDERFGIWGGLSEKERRALRKAAKA